MRIVISVPVPSYLGSNDIELHRLGESLARQLSDLAKMHSEPDSSMASFSSIAASTAFKMNGQSEKLGDHGILARDDRGRQPTAVLGLVEGAPA